MDNFASYRYTLGKNRLGKQTMGNFTNGNLTLCNLTWVYSTLYWLKVFYPWLWNLKKCQFLNDFYCSEFNSDSCVEVLYTKKDKFGTKIAYVQDQKFTPAQKLYTGMPVTPATNSRSAIRLKLFNIAKTENI